MRHLIGATACAILVLWLVAPVLAEELSNTKPEEVGFSPERLDRITGTLKADIDHHVIPGATLLIARHDKIAYFEKLGYLDPDKHLPMRDDAIFRIFSMSKPITSVAAMILFEQGRLFLGDPIAKYLRQFADIKVLAPNKDPNDNGTGSPYHLVAPKRSPSIQDLLRHTSGLTYGFWSDPVAKMYVAAGLFGGDYDNAEFVDRIAKLPLAFEPGTAWNYSNGVDVLGRVIEVVSGKSLYQFEKENILDPIGMNDTSFYVTDPANKDCIAQGLSSDNKVFGFPLFDPTVKGKWEAGGQGMESTTLDYARFLQMLLNGGVFNGHRILAPATVALMTHDHLGRIGPSTNLYLPGPGTGFGFGFAVRRSEGQATIAGSVGNYFWAGAAGTVFWNDPKLQMLVVFMIQAPKQGFHYQALLPNMVYAALADPNK
jgi:CubicO group peptidase (beta-lactamase class C family)